MVLRAESEQKIVRRAEYEYALLEDQQLAINDRAILAQRGPLSREEGIRYVQAAGRQFIRDRIEKERLFTPFREKVDSLFRCVNDVFDLLGKIWIFSAVSGSCRLVLGIIQTVVGFLLACVSPNDEHSKLRYIALKLLFGGLNNIGTGPMEILQVRAFENSFRS